jgi:two-component system, LuxR family, sensor kinase FixL
VSTDQPLKPSVTLEQLAAAVAAYNHDILLVLGPHATIAHQNAEVERLFGRTGAELYGWPLLDLVHPDDVGTLRERLEHLIPHPIVTLPAALDLRLRRADGHWSYFACNLLDRRGDPAIGGIVIAGRDITERKSIEQRLKDSETRFDTVLWGANIAFWDWDVAAQWAMHSDQWFVITGWDPKDWYADSQPWSKRVHPEDRARVEQRILDHLEGRTSSLELEYRIRCADGGWRWMLDRGRLVARDSAGRATRVTGTSMDIDARKRAEEALRQSELRYRTVGEFAEGFIQEFELDRTGQTTLRWVSEGFQRIIGLSLEEARLLGGWQVFLPPEELPAARRRMETLLKGEQTDAEVRIVDARGEERWLHTINQPLRTTDQGTIVVIGVAYDITARRRGEEALRTHGRVLEAMREGVVVLDEHSTVRLVNRALVRLTGYEPAELVGRHARMLTLLGEAQYRDVKAEIDQRLQEADFFEIDIDCVRRDGTIYRAGCVFTPIEISGERLRLVVVEDVTQRRELEREIIEIANREQRRIGNDLHDGLGQELTGVALMLRGLVGRLRKEQSPSVEDAEEIVALVNHTIESTRSLARGLSPVSVERGGLPSALRALATRVRETYGTQARFRSKIWPHIALDSGASNHIYRIAQEAVNNAIKHGHAREVIIDLHVTGETVTLIVSDNGTGVPPGANLASGMGLKIMRYRATMLGGEVKIDGRPEGGTRVILSCRQPAPTDSVGTPDADAQVTTGEELS